MYNLLKGKKGIIFGALNEASLAWQAAEVCHEEGAELVLTNAPISLRMGTMKELSEKCNNAPMIGADVSNVDEIKSLFEQSLKHFGGGIDFILHSVGMSLNVRKNKSYTEIDYGFNQKTLDISAMSLHKVLRVAWDLDALNEYASVIALTYIAAQRSIPSYNEMADAKALLESIARSFGFYYGTKKKVRINTISQSPTKTSAGQGISGFNDFYTYAEKMSPLGNASARECAEYIALMFCDYSRKVTMQNLFHDGGFSTTGITGKAMEMLNIKED